MAHCWYILMNVSFSAFHLKLYFLKKLRTHQFFIPVLWFWSCSQPSHSRADQFRADWLFGGQKPTSHGTPGVLNFPMLFLDSYSGESCKHFRYCNLMIKIMQISHFRSQRTSHDHQNNPLGPLRYGTLLFELCCTVLSQSWAKQPLGGPLCPLHQVLQCFGTRWITQNEGLCSTHQKQVLWCIFLNCSDTVTC